MAPGQATLDQGKVEEFFGKVVQDVAATLHAGLVLIGDKLGLYRAMAGAGPLTPADLAKRTGTRERYVREWLSAQAAGGYVTYDPATGDYTRSITTVDPRKNLRLDSEMRTPRTDEYSIGIDRQLGRSLAIAAAYVGKDGGNFIGWTDVGGVYLEGTREQNGRIVPVHVLENNAGLRNA